MMSQTQNFNNLIQKLYSQKQISVLKINKQEGKSYELVGLKEKNKYLLIAIDYDEDLELYRKRKVQECQDLGRFLKTNTNKNIIKYYDHFIIENYFVFMLENYETTLKDLLISGYVINQKIFTQIAIQILSTVYHLHLNNYFLKNLSTQNVFVDQDFNIILKDFGIAMQFNPITLPELYTSNIQNIPLEYLSPEVYSMLNQPIKQVIYQNEQMDIWLIGAFLYSLNDSSLSNLFKIVQGKQNYQSIQSLDQFTNQFLLKMLNENQLQRSSVLILLRQILDYEIEANHNDLSQSISEKTILIVIELFFNSKLLDQCSQILSKLIEKFPQSDIYLAWMGRVQSSLDNLDLSEYWNRKALEINVNNELAYANLGVISSKQGNLNKAITYYTKAIELKPNFERVIFNLGLAYDKQFKFKEAIQYYTQASQLDQNFTNPVYNLANIYHDQGKKSIAVLYYKKAISISNVSDQSVNNLAVIHFEGKNFEKSIKYFKKAKNLKPSDVAYSQNLKKSKQKI